MGISPKLNRRTEVAEDGRIHCLSTTDGTELTRVFLCTCPVGISFETPDRTDKELSDLNEGKLPGVLFADRARRLLNACFGLRELSVLPRRLLTLHIYLRSPIEVSRQPM